MGRIRDAIQTLLQPGWDRHFAVRDAEVSAQLAECRLVLTEMNDTLEKLSVWAAREAKRRSRAAQVDLGFTPAQQPQPNAPPVMSRAEWKAQVRRQMAGVHAGPTPPPPSPGPPEADE